MSFPYHQYVDYSNPATPRVYSWEVPSEQDALQMQQQQQQQDQAALQQQHQQQQQQQVEQQQHQQQERVSPSQLQLQQLPPPPPPLLTPQDVQHQQQQQQRQQQQQQAQYTPHPQTINLQPATNRSARGPSSNLSLWYVPSAIMSAGADRTVSAASFTPLCREILKQCRPLPDTLLSDLLWTVSALDCSVV
ncbi:hypothetical protein NUW54_g11106 [Trametes sanguinea]|uniref:Uncharacterized protein n=1 Tax=Trametes sanguinea TaxID=158606 RepID=A0ACC1NK78_9APHY|nr:hypothetical protein NUW54_g11106 [Trametes sanguinea]